MVSPSKNPQGLSGSILSNITLIIAVSGSERNIPGTPQSSPPIEILYKINQGNGALGRLIQDSSIAENLDVNILNLRKSSKGLNENMEAAKSNILLRGYFKKKAKEREAEKKQVDAKQEQNDKQN